MSSSSPGEEDDKPNAGSRSNIAAIVAVVVLVVLGYWAFHYIDHQRKMQDCLDSGRRNCEELLGAGK